MRVKFFLFLALCASTVRLSAEERPPVAVNPAGPPFTISGFEYRLVSPATHMNDCSQPSCGIGSKVSYFFYLPTSGHTFEAYKAERKKVEDETKLRIPAGMTIKITPPSQKKDKLFTTFESRRVVTAPDGRKQVTVSRTVLAKNLGADLISSGGNEEQVDANLAQFTLAVMTVAQIRAGNK